MGHHTGAIWALKLIGKFQDSSLNFLRLLRVVFPSQQRLNRPVVNAVQ